MEAECRVGTAGEPGGGRQNGTPGPGYFPLTKGRGELQELSPMYGHPSL